MPFIKISDDFKLYFEEVGKAAFNILHMNLVEILKVGNLQIQMYILPEIIGDCLQC